jgi:hypothetical protein
MNMKNLASFINNIANTNEINMKLLIELGFIEILLDIFGYYSKKIYDEVLIQCLNTLGYLALNESCAQVIIKG